MQSLSALLSLIYHVSLYSKYITISIKYHWGRNDMTDNSFLTILAGKFVAKLLGGTIGHSLFMDKILSCHSNIVPIEVFTSCLPNALHTACRGRSRTSNQARCNFLLPEHLPSRQDCVKYTHTPLKVAVDKRTPIYNVVFSTIMCS